MNKALLIVKCMKILGNSMSGLLLYQKHLLYRTCILLITLYEFLLWYYYKILLPYSLKELRKMQRMLWQPLITKTNSSTTSKSLSRISSGDYKKTWQEVSIIFLYYLYKSSWSMLTINGPSVMSMCSPCFYHVLTLYLP